MEEGEFVTPAYSDYSMRQIINKLAEYEDTEEQGLILRSRAGVGSKVYDTDGNEFIVKHFTYYSYMQPHFEYEAHNEEGLIMRFKDIHIDKFVFLTKEEAEAELIKRQEGGTCEQ